MNFTDINTEFDELVYGGTTELDYLDTIEPGTYGEPLQETDDE